MSDAPPNPPTPSRRRRPAEPPSGTTPPSNGAAPPAPAGGAGAQMAQAAQDPVLLAQVAKLLMGDGEAGPAVVDATDDEGSLIQFVKTGWIRFPAAVVVPDEPRVYRLRRPFLGELHRLRTAYEAAGDEIDLAKLDFIDAEATHEAAVKAAAELPEPARSKANLEANIARRKARRDMDARHLAVRIEWWAQVFRALCVDWPAGTLLAPAEDDEGKTGGPPVPAGWEWGAWVEDASLPVLVINHWRSVPLDRGA